MRNTNRGPEQDTVRLAVTLHKIWKEAPEECFENLGKRVQNRLAVVIDTKGCHSMN
jgi:hypothetical protein